MNDSSGIVLRRGSGLPLYRQLVDQLRYLIAAGRYHPGSYLPTMRELASELGVNFNTINRAYRQLQRDGLVRSTQGKGAMVVGEGAARQPSPAPVSSVEVDAILAAAIERALAAGVSPGELAGRLAAQLEAAASRVPPPPRLRVEAGASWRAAPLAARLAEATGHEAVAGKVDDARERVEVTVVPIFGTWRPEVDGGDAMVEVALVLARDAVRALVALEPESRLCIAAADAGVATWLLDAATFAGPAATRAVVADDGSGIELADDEWLLFEEGLPGARAIAPERAIEVAGSFSPAALAAVDAAVVEARNRRVG